MSMSDAIKAAMDEVVTEFSPFCGDRAMTLNYLMELGQQLPGLTPEERQQGHRVSGCQAQVWLLFHYETNRMFIRGDSDAMVTKGLLALLIQILSGQKTSDIALAKPHLPASLGLETFLTQQRRGGFLQMWADVTQAARQHEHA